MMPMLWALQCNPHVLETIMQRFNFHVSFRVNGVICNRKYTTITKDIGIARAWVYATTAIDGLDVVEITDLE